MITNVILNDTENLGRQEEVDWARGFSAILIIIVHVGLYLGNDIDHGLWTFCDIIGSEPCAPVLMTLMGISMAYSKHQRPDELLKRGVGLFVMGYTLNFFRSILPLLLFGSIDEWASLEAFLVVDILQFAGLSLMLIALLKKLKLSGTVIFALSIVMVVINQLIMLPDTISWHNEWLTGLVNLFCPVTAWSCFPFLTWFIFPAFGLAYGEMLTHCTHKNKLYGLLLPVGLCGTVTVYGQFVQLYPNYTAYYWGNNFYYMGLKNVLLTLLIICFCLSFWFFAGKILPNTVKKQLEYLSKNLNAIYIISWIIISLLIHAQALFGWTFGTWLTIGVMVLVIIGSVWLTKLRLPAKGSFKGKSLL